MIVDMVEREAVVRQLRDYNVSYVQGILFCEPKPVRPEIFDNQSIVAA
jgi:EAL domain-containing protein (putative c-di-GMP-specific phosphodiesterase class I)